MSRSTLKSTRFLSLVLTAILIVATLLMHPAWPHARNFGYAPFLVSAALACLCVLILFFGPERSSHFRESFAQSGQGATGLRFAVRERIEDGRTANSRLARAETLTLPVRLIRVMNHLTSTR